MRTAALVAASSFNAAAFLRFYEQHSYDDIVAVDAGYAHLQAIGVTPTLVVGDFDSLGFVPSDIPTVRFPEEKDDSDLGLALDWCADNDIDSVSVYGAFAGRLDHTFAAIQTMAGFALGMHRAVRGISDTAQLVVVPGGHRLLMPGADQGLDFCVLPKEQLTVSVISLSDCSRGVTIQGMKYELGGGDLTNCCSLGLSNELIGNDASVSLAEGCVLVTLPLYQEIILSCC